MHDQAAVRVLDAVAYLEHEPDALRDGQALPIAVLVDGLAVHVLHDEVGRALVGQPTVEEAGDVRMTQAGQQAALGQKAGPGLL